MELSLIRRIKHAQEDSGELLLLIEQFKPLLCQYARLLRYDDAYYDMQAEFIALLLKIKIDCLTDLTEFRLIAYLNKSMRNAFMKYSIKAGNYRGLHKLFSEMNEKELYHAENSNAVWDKYTALEYEHLFKILSENEAEVIILHYNMDYSVNEIAVFKHTSRMTVNRWKNKALEKLRGEDKLI